MSTTKISILFAILTISVKSQLSGVYTIPGSFPTIAAAINSLNAVGVSGPVTINVATGYTETAITGGYTLNTITGASATNSVVFQKSGAGNNPVVYAYAGGNGMPGTGILDGVWRFAGTDFVTIDGIDITDLNTTNNATMEFGFGFYKASGFGNNGCQYNTIQNCKITLSRVNQEMNSFANSGNGGISHYHGSIGISLMCTIMSFPSANSNIVSTSDSHSYNKFYSNTIMNCYTGISIIGYNFNHSITLHDTGNDIGGNSASTGNTIINFGCSQWQGLSSQSAGIFYANQADINISYNTLNANNGAAANTFPNIEGIFTHGGNMGTTTINHNTISLKSDYISGGNGNSGISLYNQLPNNGNEPWSQSINISNNLITNCSFTSTGSEFYGIYNSANAAVISINNNTITGITFGSANGTGNARFSDIFTEGTYSAACLVDNNLINVGTFPNPVSAFQVSGISLSGPYNGSSNGGTLSVSNNSLQGANYTGVSGGSNNPNYPFHFIRVSSGVGSLYNVDNNIFNNINLKHSGTIYLITANMSGSHNCSVNNNRIVGGFSFPNAVGDVVRGLYMQNSSGSGTLSVSNNNFSNVSLNSRAFYGVHLSGLNQDLVLASNTFTNISSASSFIGALLNCQKNSTISNNTITTIVGANDIKGINYTSTSNGACKISQNTIGSFSSSATSSGSSLAAILSSVSVNGVIEKNRIYDIQALGRHVFGIFCSADANQSITNNIIGDLRSAASTTDAVRAIYLTGTDTCKMFHNTVYLNSSATSTGNISTSALYIDQNCGVDLKNNILINQSVPSGTGITSCIYARSANTNKYLNTSNNNILYAGTPSANNLLYADPSNSIQTLATLKTTFSPRESNSYTESTLFTSTVGTNSGFLHLNTGSATYAESGALSLLTVTDDIDGDVRFGNTGYTGNGAASDVGADETNAVGYDFAGPVITFSNQTVGCVGSDGVVTANITDLSGIPTSGNLLPRLYFNKNNGSYVSTPGSLQSGNANNGTWNFTISAAALGGISQGDVINYFFVAQDQSTTSATPNIGASPSPGFLASNVNSVTVPPTSTYSLTLDVCLDITNLSLNNLVKLFPNPNKGTFSINIPFENGAGIEVFDSTGRKIYNGKLSEGSSQVSIPWPAKGIYLVQIKTRGNVVKTKMVVE